MNEQIALLLKDARLQRAEGRAEAAERVYSKAAQLARSENDLAALAHALRHLSDLARARGASAEALESASEAVHIYRGSDDRLGLANAIRLKALSAATPGESKACWKEARTVYELLGVSAGVCECDSHLIR
jgi:tetratricopeptide (TPR) repeat protein